MKDLTVIYYKGYVQSYVSSPDDINVYIYETYCATKTSTLENLISETS